MMLRNFTEVFKQSVAGKWGSRVPQRSLKGMRITVLGTGNIGSTFARRVKAFEPACITGVCRSGNCDEPAFDRVCKSSALDEIKSTYGFDTAAIVTMKEVTEYLYNTERQGKVWIDDELKKAIDEYYAQYGAK